MRVTFVGRNVVCLAAMPPEALDLAPFSRLAGASKPRAQVSTPQLAVAEYDRLKLISTPDGRLQVDLPADSRRDTARRVAAEAVRQAGRYAMRAVGFNGLARIDIDEGDNDPVRPLLRDDLIASRIGEVPSRRGVKLIYASGEARMTFDLSPIDDEERGWLASVNRHLAAPVAQSELAAAEKWFADLRDDLVSMVVRVIEVSPDEESKNAA